MFPVLFTIGNFPVSSFGLLLGLGIFLAGFTVWRIARAYDYDAERVLDIIFLTVGVGFIFSRLTFVLTNLELFNSITQIFFINRYPGLSFWGGFVGGLITLSWLSKKNRIPVFQAGDFAIVGFLIGAFFSQIGCLLGSCGVGVETSLWFGVDQVGVIGKRLPIQLFEALAFLIFFLIFWKSVLKFHIQGSLFAKGLILLALIKFIAEFYKAQPQMINLPYININLNLIFAVLIFALGFRFYYRAYKKTPRSDLHQTYRLISDRNKQRSVMTKIIRGWYNQKANLWVSLVRGKKKLFKLLNIKSNPQSF